MIRAIALSFAFSWLLFPGFGLIDLSVTWTPGWPQALEAGWGLFFTIFVGIGFVFVAMSPYRAAPAIVQLYVASVALAVSAVLALEFALLVWALAIAAETALVSRLTTGELRPSGQTFQVARPLAAVALLGSLPWLAYAFRMHGLNRQELSSADVTVFIDHYSVQGAFGLTVAVLAVAAAVWPTGRGYIGVGVGAASVYLGIVSLKWYPTPGALNRTWSILCVAWGFAMIVISIASRVTSRRSEGLTGPSRR
jgi:uncharacterized membrane protein